LSVRSFRRAHARRLARERRRLEIATRRGALVAGAALSASALMVSSAEGATFTVTNNNDSGPGSLRQAIADAGASADPSNSITFASGLSPITLSSGALSITSGHNLTITGPATIDANHASQAFNISGTSPSTNPSNQVTLSDLTIENGTTSAPGGAIENVTGGPDALGLTLTNDRITGSTTTSTSGGGGVYSVGPVTISGSTISGNTAASGTGGGLAVSEHNTSPSNKYHDTISNSTISGNTALNGGGLAAGGTGGPYSGAELDVTASHITGNTATSGTSSNGYGGGVIAIGGGLTVENGSTVSGNTSTNRGGGIWTATKYGTEVTNSTVSGNTSANGGGIEITGVSGGPHTQSKYNPVHILDSTISGNQATNGAGVDVRVATAGDPVTIESSTISGNHGGAGSFGGGLLAGKYIIAPVKVIDSTISGNTAAHGGGVSLGYGGSTNPLLQTQQNSSGSFTFENSTIAANTATASAGGGGIYLAQYNTGSANQSAEATLRSTIVSGNTAAGAANDLARPTTSTSGGFHGAFSLIQTPGGAPMLSSDSDITGVDPKLGPLANNGGPTQTMLPAGTSPVIDQGHASKSLGNDQIGNPRTVDVPGIPNPAGGDGTDIGAVELPANRVIVPTAGLSASVRGVLIGGRKPPLVVVGSTPVNCAVHLGTLDSCFVQVKLKSGKVLASGGSTSTGSPTSLSVPLSLTSAGASALAHSGMGLTVPATVTASTSRSGSQTVKGNVHLLAQPSFTVPLQKRSSKLAGSVLANLREIAQLITGARSATCTAYSDRGRRDVSLTSAQAKAACAALKKDGFKGKLKSVGKGHAHLIASPHSSKNRRLIISFKF
jgi:hypothetical protein